MNCNTTHYRANSSSVPGDPTGNIKVTYTAGYVTLPADLVLAVHQLAAQIRRTAGLGAAAASESYGTYRYAIDLRGDEFASVRRLLARHKAMDW